MGMKPTPRSLHKEHYKLVEDKPNMYLNHQYHPQTKDWKFMGYRCDECDQSLRQVTNILKHNTLCKVLNPKKQKQYGKKKTKLTDTDV